MELLATIEERIQQLLDEGQQDQALLECRNVILWTTTKMASLLSIQNALPWMQHLAALFPNDPMTLSNLANLLYRQGRLTEAVMISKVAVNSKAKIADIYYNHGTILNDLNCVDEAIEMYKTALEIKPDYAIVHYNLGSCYMQKENYAAGLKEYEWRKKAHTKIIEFRQRYEKPDWNGKDSLKGKTVLVVNDQGIGDAIMFCRYLPMLKKKGCSIVLEVQDELVSLFKQLDVEQVCGRSHNLSEKRPLPPHDYIVDFFSLPYLCDPDLTHVACEPYLKVSKKKIALKKCNKKVGICWSGSEWNSMNTTRSCPLRYFEPLSKIPGIGLFSLQKEELMTSTWRTSLREGTKMKVMNTDTNTSDFNNTANLIENLDLVITVCTSIAHLSGAMGKPVWLLLAYKHDWRWDVKPPWYSSMRIFQQEKAGDWEGVMKRVVEELSHIQG